MSAIENSAIENTPVSMRDLLASCAAAELISTPPRAPEPTTTATTTATATAMVVRTPAPSPSRAA
ncbi:hypothetical protein ACFRI7_04625 [Streptomyces sp. NPDC056716]|uniref:hypothetical protein n=1 Tax=unclassified Streptomyces TaxID=2593676 RepID=UPI0036ACC70C